MGTYILEYIWLDSNYQLRSKTKVFKTSSISENLIDIFPQWNYDGSSTGQATGDNSEIIIKPCSFYPDPFRYLPNSYLVLCDTYTREQNNSNLLIPHVTNNRVNALEIFNKYKNEKPMYGIEQEFFLSDIDYKPLFVKEIQQSKDGVWDPQGNYYCGIGARNIIGRQFIEEALELCVYAELNITGMNAEVAPGQWECQVCATGIDVCDQLYILRYILQRLAEKYDWTINFHPKPVEGDWNGSGCHVNFSTENMRNENGMDHILNGIEKLAKKHEEHMSVYGTDNEKRMTGKHETADYNSFNYGVANRGASIRIPVDTATNKKGYFEDRRPASNMDPYLVTSKILETVME
jgi:glutamine synthetase